MDQAVIKETPNVKGACGTVNGESAMVKSAVLPETSNCIPLSPAYTEASAGKHYRIIH